MMVETVGGLECVCAVKVLFENNYYYPQFNKGESET